MTRVGSNRDAITGLGVAVASVPGNHDHLSVLVRDAIDAFFRELDWAELCITSGAEFVIGEGPADAGVLRFLARAIERIDKRLHLLDQEPAVRARGIPFGVYAQVVRPGRLSVGDPVCVERVAS